MRLGLFELPEVQADAVPDPLSISFLWKGPLLFNQHQGAVLPSPLLLPSQLPAAAVPWGSQSPPGAQGGWDDVPGPGWGSISLSRLSAAQWPESPSWHGTWGDGAATSSTCACTSPAVGWLIAAWRG